MPSLKFKLSKWLNYYKGFSNIDIVIETIKSIVKPIV